MIHLDKTSDEIPAAVLLSLAGWSRERSGSPCHCILLKNLWLTCCEPLNLDFQPCSVSSQACGVVPQASGESRQDRGEVTRLASPHPELEVSSDELAASHSRFAVQAFKPVVDRFKLDVLHCNFETTRHELGRSGGKLPTYRLNLGKRRFRPGCSAASLTRLVSSLEQGIRSLSGEGPGLPWTGSSLEESVARSRGAGTSPGRLVPSLHSRIVGVLGPAWRKMGIETLLDQAFTWGACYESPRGRAGPAGD